MKINPVESPSGWIRRLVPVQSVRQLKSYVFFTSTGVFVCELFLRLFGLPSRLPAVAIGAFCASSVMLQMMLPARLRINTGHPSETMRAFGAIRAAAIAYGYKSIHEVESGHVEFSTAWIEILRGRENTIGVDVATVSICVTGPVSVLRILRRRLLSELIDA